MMKINMHQLSITKLKKETNRQWTIETTYVYDAQQSIMIIDRLSERMRRWKSLIVSRPRTPMRLYVSWQRLV